MGSAKPSHVKKLLKGMCCLSILSPQYYPQQRIILNTDAAVIFGEPCRGTIIKGPFSNESFILKHSAVSSLSLIRR